MSPEPPEPLNPNELQRHSSDDLIAYIRTAAADGHADRAQEALAVLSFRHFDDVVRRVSMRVPRQDVEDIAMVAITEAIRSAFDGTSIGEFVNWLHTIVDRRGIADYHRNREREPKTAPLPTEHLGEDDVWGEEPAVSDEAGAVVVQSVIDECLTMLSDSHRDAVELNVFDDIDAAATATLVNEHFPDLETAMSQANVHKIVSRFRESVRDRLEGRDG